MKPEDILPGETYGDGATAIRTVKEIVMVDHEGEPRQCVLYHEHAGPSRGQVHSLPMETFTAFAVLAIAEHDIVAAEQSLGLNAYPVDTEIARLIVETEGRTITPRNNDDAVRLERLVGLGLAVRKGPRLRARCFVIGDELAEAAKRTRFEN